MVETEVIEAPRFDWQTPDYGPVYHQRIERLARLRANPQSLPECTSITGNVQQHLSTTGA
jgi:hypothetical protein